MEGPPQETAISKRGESLMSKKRFFEIQSMIHEILQNPVLETQIIDSIMNIMNFDPNVSQYTPSVARKIKEYRRKKKEKGT